MCNSIFCRIEIDCSFKNCFSSFSLVHNAARIAKRKPEFSNSKIFSLKLVLLNFFSTRHYGALAPAPDSKWTHVTLISKKL